MPMAAVLTIFEAFLLMGLFKMKKLYKKLISERTIRE
jgi:hypothetical protein